MIFPIVNSNGIFKEVFVFWKKGTVFESGVPWLPPAHPLQIVFFSNCGADVAEWKVQRTSQNRGSCGIGHSRNKREAVAGNI